MSRLSLQAKVGKHLATKTADVCRLRSESFKFQKKIEFEVRRAFGLLKALDKKLSA